ncbi:MAG: argininosuccinate lyase [Pseudomonadota bacterium]|nr:argininosuccinate lyase [Pseudomonadota bacterium]MDE3038853.1 argininosuccinate lyase [Pseudomonadota bacterium]
MADSKKSKAGKANPMWGGQFSIAPAELLAKINASVAFDKRLYRQDIRGSIAHANMLARQGIISRGDARAIVAGLQDILKDIEAERFIFSDALEDVHMNIESVLKNRIGEAGGRLHTARSRNDQVATDLRLYVRDALDALAAALAGLQAALLKRASEHAATIMPGFTHLQAAQPVTLGHHLLAYVEMFGRDRARARDARSRMNESPLGAAALAGTSFPIDRHFTAKELGFDAPMRNSIDAVSDRDFALEFLALAAICAVHMSRLAEEFVLWSSAPFSFIRFSDSWSTGSSIMPQKRNPDAAELVRGKAGRMSGNLMALLAVMKSLPLAYNKDMQEDKEPVFDSAENILLCVRAMAGMADDFNVAKERMARAAGEAYANATDLADWLTRELDMPFRKAHHVTARLVALAAKQEKRLEALTLTEMQSIEPGIRKEMFSVLAAADSVKSRRSFGGTAPDNVKKAIVEAKKRFGV